MVRNWSDGETLTASAMNELTTSMTLRFMTAAERDATLVGALAPAAGMRVFMLDSNLVWTYVVVSGTGFWAPQPGTLIFSHFQTVAQAMPAGLQLATFTNLNGSQFGRNLNNWFNGTTGRFLPLAPGHYEFSGGAATTSGTVQFGVRLNSASSMVQSSISIGYGALGTPVAWALRRWTCYLNGVSDYAEFAAIYPGAYTTALTAGREISFAAKYLGL